MTRISEQPWSEISQADYPDAAAYCSACLIDANEADTEKTKEHCPLPVYESGGALNRNGVHAAAARLAGAGGGMKLSAEEQKKAAKQLVTLYQDELEEEPPESKMQVGALMTRLHASWQLEKGDARWWADSR